MVETGHGTAPMFFIGLFTSANDIGILRWDKRKLGMDILSVLYMQSRDDIDSWIEMMVELEMIVRYEVNGHTYMFLPSWYESQNIRNPNYTEHPLPPEKLLIRYPGYVRGLRETISRIISLLRKKITLNQKKITSLPKRLIETEEFIESIYEKGYAIQGVDTEKDISDRVKDKQKQITSIQTGKDVFDMINSFYRGFNKGELSGLAKKVIEGDVKVKQLEGKKVDKKPTDLKSRSIEASQKVQSIYEKQGKAGELDSI